jgi:hypothetical protein
VGKAAHAQERALTAQTNSKKRKEPSSSSSSSSSSSASTSKSLYALHQEAEAERQKQRAASGGGVEAGEKYFDYDDIMKARPANAKRNKEWINSAQSLMDDFATGS